MPAGLVEDHHGVGIRGDLGRDLGQVQAHRRGVDLGKNERSGPLAGRAHRGKDVGGGVPLILGLARSATTACPASAAPMLRLHRSGRVGAPEGRVSSPFRPIRAFVLT